MTFENYEIIDLLKDNEYFFAAGGLRSVMNSVLGSAVIFPTSKYR